MILNCNSCEKKFVVPDQAITANGRSVQCGSCGNKWKQFPIKSEKSNIDPANKISIKKVQNLHKANKPKKKKVKKTRKINLYSPEYLAKKHGISLDSVKIDENNKSDKKVTFGFYNSFILFVVIVIFLSRGLYFAQDFIVEKIPISEFYISYFFENIRNIFEIIKNLF